MQLRAAPPSIPARGVAGAGSFPLEPAGVDAWLAGLAPLETDAGARELLRGLMHSNRLHNDVERRRATLALFSGPLGALYERLSETARAQPLPLAPEFERARALAADLLREESIAFRSLLHDADEPLEADASLAMRALERLARLDAEAYRTIDPGTLSDAHALYAWCSEAGLARTPTADRPEDADGVGARYRLVLALTLIDPQRHRARQLPLLVQWLAREAHRVRLSAPADSSGGANGADEAVAAANRRAPGRWLVEPVGGTQPVPAGAALLPAGARPLVIDTDALLAEASRRHSVPGAAATSLPGADTLERQTFARLVATLGPPPGRRFARRAADAAAELVFGHRHICARLFYADDPAGLDDVVHEPRVDGSVWRMLDRTASGMQLVTREARAGLAQVGELVTVHEAPAEEDDDAASSRSAGATAGTSPGASGERHRVLIGVVRRVRTARGGALHVGVEFLAHQAMPVSITREDDASAAPERALVVACRIAGQNLQTVLVPAFLYQTGDRLRATRDGRSRSLELARCLQANGLYSQYVITTPEP